MKATLLLLAVMTLPIVSATPARAQGWHSGTEIKTEAKEAVPKDEAKPPAPRPDQAVPQEHATEIQAILKENFQKDGPGVAVLVSRNGVPLYEGCYGVADVKTQRPITPDTLFDLASCSKHMTAVAILTLAEQGKLSLDQPVSDYLKDYAVPVKGRPVTISDLLHHVSGLADYCGDEWDGSDEEFAALTPETHLQWLNTTKPRRAPGVKYVYNNTEYVLLSLIVSRVSGQNYSDYVRTHLFQPAGMTQTAILDGQDPLPSSTVKGYKVSRNGKVAPSFSPTMITGDGNIYTSLHDLIRWDAALRQHTIISAKSQDLAWTNGHFDSGKPIADEDGDGYGCGWVVETDGENVSHDGAWDGTATYLRMNKKTGLTVAVLSNDENADVVSIGQKIAGLF